MSGRGGRYEYCALFVDSDDRDHLMRIVADVLDGQASGRSDVSGQGLEVAILRNSLAATSDDFLGWASKLEVEQAGAEDAMTVRLVRSLVTRLREAGLRVVAASDYEDELPPQTFAG